MMNEDNGNISSRGSRKDEGKRKLVIVDIPILFYYSFSKNYSS